MLAIDVKDIENAKGGVGIFGFSFFHPLRFVETDYIKNDPSSLSQRIRNKVTELNGYCEIERVTMLVQVRCFGIYFSPVNFYFCYDKQNQCTQMLAEVSNTPWNERHYYLIDLKVQSDAVTKKAFQVSPFMDLSMDYVWKVSPPDEREKLLVQIENRAVANNGDRENKLFTAKLVMTKRPFNTKELVNIWLKMPVMTIKVVLAIYWQAIKLFAKKVPFIGYMKPE